MQAAVANVRWIVRSQSANDKVGAEVTPGGAARAPPTKELAQPHFTLLRPDLRQ
jgi:hypothetical protein